MAEDQLIAIKTALLRYYSRQGLYHVGFLFTFITAFKIIADDLDKQFKGIFVGLLGDLAISASISTRLYYSLIVATSIVCLLYLSLRTLYWGSYPNEVIELPMGTVAELTFASIQNECYNRLLNHETARIRWVSDLATRRRILLPIVFLISFIASMLF